MKFSILASLGVNTKAYQNGLDMAKKQTDSFSKKVTSSLKNIALTFGGFNLAKNIIQLGMASKETANMFDTVFADSLGRMNEELKELNRIIPESEISIKEALAVFRQMANGFGITGEKANDFALQMVKVGSDFASFRNLKPEEMFVKMRSAVAGMSRPMMDLGINTQVARLEQEAMTLGLEFTSGKLSSAQKAYLVLMTTLKQMGVILGDQERTNQSTANQFKHLEKRAKDLGARIGEKLLPHLENLITATHKLIDFFERNAKAVKTLGGAFLKLFVAVKTTSLIMKAGAVAVTAYKTAVFILSGQLFKNVSATVANTKAQKVNTVATKTSTVATNSFTLALRRLRIAMMRTPVTLLMLLLSDYIAKTYMASTATKEFADGVDVDTDKIQENINQVVLEMEKYGSELQKMGTLDPYEKALNSGKNLIDTTKSLTEQIKQYFDLVQEGKEKEADRIRRARELQKVNAEIAGDTERVEQLELEIELLDEAVKIMNRHGFSLKFSLLMAKQLLQARKSDPSNQMLEEQEDKLEQIKQLEMELMEAEISGQEKLAEKLQKRIEAEKRALDIAKEHNITLKEAQDIVRGLIDAENKRSAKKTAEDLIGKDDKNNRNLLRSANEFGREKGISFSREDLGGGRQGFRRYDNGSRGDLFSRDQLLQGVGEQAMKAEESGETEVLERIEKILEGKFKNE